MEIIVDVETYKHLNAKGTNSEGNSFYLAFQASSAAVVIEEYDSADTIQNNHKCTLWRRCFIIVITARRAAMAGPTCQMWEVPVNPRAAFRTNTAVAAPTIDIDP